MKYSSNLFFDITTFPEITIISHFLLKICNITSTKSRTRKRHTEKILSSRLRIKYIVEIFIEPLVNITYLD